MQNRGPDHHEWFSPNKHIVMGHGRLSIIDLSENSNQPISKGRYTMTYNGEIYNFKDFGNYASDTLMLIDQIEKNGFTKDFLNKLNGMFALAVYDSADNTIHFAVDSFGQKPLYYIHDKDKLAFASTPSALTCLRDKWNLERNALDSLFCLGSVTGERSLFEGIRKLPGSYMASFNLATKEFKKSQWWFVDPKSSDIEGEVIKAIDKVKVSDVPVNIYLSGGIDSTLVAERFNGSLAIHLDSEEVVYAKQAAKKNGINLKVLPVEFDKEKILEDYALKTGDCSMSVIQPYIVSEAASKFGKVAVIANGADELFYGYDRTRSDGQIRHIMRGGYESFVHELFDLYKKEFDDAEGDLFERLLELRMFVQNDLNKTLDFASMCHSVEVRSPFLDPNLVNSALSLSYKDHYSHEYKGKHILKTMLSKSGYDDRFTKRIKLGFSLPKKYQKSNDAELSWCIENGFLKQREDWNERDKAYVGYTASAFKSWYNVWKHKLT